jgi:hypothetical protein
VEKSARDKIRAKVLSEQIKRVIVEIEGTQIEVRQMSVGQMLDSISVEDGKARMAQYLIDCCFVPGTEDKVFDSADLDVLMAMPAGGYYAVIMAEVNKQLLPKQLEAAGKS